MIGILFAASLWGGAPPIWLDQAFEGRPGSKWTAIVSMDRPGRDAGTDTGKACRDGRSERIDFRHGSHFMSGDSSVFLETSSRTAWVGPRRHFPSPPPDMEFGIVRSETLLGRQVVVAEIRDPRGHGRRMWVDTALPLVLRSEALNRERRGPERQFLSLQPGIPCPPGSFLIPPGWTLRQGPPPSPKGADGRIAPEHRRHAVATPEELAAAVGFAPPSPPWLPNGFAARNWAWVESRQGRAAQILYGDGRGSVSIFFRIGGNEPPPIWPPEGCKDRQGRSVYFGKSGKFELIVTGDLPPEQMEKVVGIRK